MGEGEYTQNTHHTSTVCALLTELNNVTDSTLAVACSFSVYMYLFKEIVVNEKPISMRGFILNSKHFTGDSMT